MTFAVESSPDEIAVAFARVLRSLEIPTPLDSVLTFMNALSLVGIDDRESVYWAGRTTLVRRPEDIPAFNNAFRVFWDHRESPEALPEELSHITVALDTEDEGSADGEAQASDEPTITVRFSGVETLSENDFAEYSDNEMRLAQRFMETLRMAGPPRPSLRTVSTRRRGTRPDMRRTVRASLAAAGEPMRRRWTKKGTKPRRIVFLLDVSGSMRAHSCVSFMPALLGVNEWKRSRLVPASLASPENCRRKTPTVHCVAPAKVCATGVAVLV